MTLTTGSRLGPYEITAAIGAGGMGEVYRARDSKLGRDVALKVLPEAFARDAERLARFQREAKLLASLNHPNIASIYGLEDSAATHALVMELVEGPTLADRIKQGPIPIDESLRIARQIADALEYAHERGIVHRDLKPANVKVTPDDAVKVLDFGLAKAMEGDAASLDISTSPTVSRMATQAGVLLGTAAYMSPEQAKAKPVDRRADIWAFGCVLYEMLTGKMAFSGETVSDTLAAVIRGDPDWALLPSTTPMRVRVLLERCLQKDPKQRLRDIGDARISIDEVLSGAPEGASSLAATGRPTTRPWLSPAGVIGGLLVGAIIAGLAVWNLKPASPPAKPVTRFTIALPPGQHLARLDQRAVALSPDGTELAYVATAPGGDSQQIYMRRMDTGETKLVVGTEGAYDPFFSPDSQWIGFFASAELKKLPVNGGVAQLFGDTANSLGATWGSGGTIVYAPVLSVLEQVPDAGGMARPLTRFTHGESGHYWPEFLPNGKGVLFLTSAPPSIDLQPLGTDTARTLLQGQVFTMPSYATSGHLVYAQAGNLMAAPFDLDRMEVKGEGVAVLQGVLQYQDPTAPSQYSLSASGSLAYLPGGLSGVQSKLVWVRRNGTEEPLGAPMANYNQPRLSPDGRRIAVGVVELAGAQQIELYDLSRDALSRFTFEGGSNQYPTWTPGGKHIAFMTTKQGVLEVFWQLADGGGGLEQLTYGKTTSVPFSWSPDGQLLAGVTVVPPNFPEIFVMRMSDRQIRRFLPTHTANFEDAPQFSPDGHWIAYASAETGRREIYVQPYPGPGGKWQVSTDGGNEPQWNRNGGELFYREGDRMMAVDISATGGFVAGKPRLLFEGNYLKNSQGYARPNYDISLDGERFLMIKSVDQGQPAPTQINVVLNWTEELKRLVPTGK